ncbi:MAG: hypothetical protein GY835_13900 [bacterium]|nr:hypothetical protein [bacterium]
MKNLSKLSTLCFLLLILTQVAAAGTLFDEIDEVRDGWVHFECEAKEGVRGDSDIICIRDHLQINHAPRCRSGHHDDWDDDDWDDNDWDDFEEGPLHVSLRMHRGEVEDVDICIGDSDFRLKRRAQDLGEVAPEEASRALLELVAADAGPDVGDCILPATLTKGFDDWGALLDLARNRRLNEDTRDDCIFWLGQAAGDEATRGLRSIVNDDDEDLGVRESAIFAISQQDSDESFPILKRIAMNNPHPKLRRSAMFWLAQLDDDRVIELLEEILLED